MDGEKVLAQGGVERIGIGRCLHQMKLPNGDKKIMADLPTHKKKVSPGVQMPDRPVIGFTIKSLDEIDAVGHRLSCRGGDLFEKSCIVTAEVEKGIESLIDLALSTMPVTCAVSVP